MITVDEQKHTYTNQRGEKYLPATSLVKMFTEEYDRKAHAIRQAKKVGNTPEYWIALWEAEEAKGQLRGNTFHKQKEDYFNGRGMVIYKQQVQFVQNENFFEPDALAPGAYIEKLLWNDTHRIAGKPDVVVVRKPTVIVQGEQPPLIVDIDDHKTNKVIHTKSYFFEKTKAHKMMKYPLNHLMDCNFIHHELQVSIYAFMLEQWGYQIGDLTFTHYPHPVEKIGASGVTYFEEPLPVVYPLEYRKKEVKLMLNFYRTNRKAA